MNEILEEFEDKSNKTLKNNLSFYAKVLALVVAVIIFGVYVGDILFGKNSLDVLLNLQRDKDFLEKKVDDLKNKNATLQKEYFELKDLDPDNKEN